MHPIKRDKQARTLRELIANEFAAQNWHLENGLFSPPTPAAGKDFVRESHRAQRIERAKSKLPLVTQHGSRLLQEFGEGGEVDPAKFSPILIPVAGDSFESRLFRFASLLWSVPIREGYGRRIRYIIRDNSNGKLVGLISLMDPVFNLTPRDMDIGWNAAQREERLYNVMEANGLGAVPPYDRLLGGKFVALAAVSDRIREDFAKKYRGRTTVIRAATKQASLVLVTTSSALGRSSIYNRLRLKDEDAPVYRSVGYSKGWGHYQITDATFKEIRTWLREIGDQYADGHYFGAGPNWRMRTIRKAFDLLGFDGNALQHGIQREVFVAPLASNYRQFLQGKTSRPAYYHRDLDEIAEFFKERWMIPRSERIDDWKGWTRGQTWQRIVENCGLTANLILC